MRIKKKKILFIIWSYTYGGGAEALLTMIVNHLNPEKYEISIIEYQHADYKVEPVREFIHVLPPIEAVEVQEKEKAKKGYQVYHMPELLRDRYIGGDYDLYVSFNYQIPTFLLPERTRNIAWIHGDVYDLAADDFARERRLQDKAFDKVQKIVAINDYTRQSLEALFPGHKDKILTLFSGIDLEKVREKAEETAGWVLPDQAVVSVARLDENKNPLRLLGIFEKVHAVRPEAKLYYMGDGALREELEREIIRAGMEESVRLLGYVQNPYPLMKQAKLCCLMSESEGNPVSLMESLALGVPFVSTDVGGCGTLTNGQKCGRTIKTDEEAVGAILELLEVRREDIRRECTESVKRFALEDYIARIEQLFDACMEKDL